MSTLGEPLRRHRLLEAAPVIVAITIALAYGLNAQALIRYPWDWSSDEGFYLDCARRVLQAPETVYGDTLVPYPCFYTPLLFVILAPVTGAQSPLAWGRVIAAIWTGVTVGAAFVLVRRRGPAPLAAGCAALVLAPLDLSFWHLLVRMDGLMIALWMLSAIALLPREVAGGADRLGKARLIAGVAALVAAFLAKQTALVHGAPLVLCWFLVDRRSAIRLSGAAIGAVGGALLALEIVSGGGFSQTTHWWGAHPLELHYLKRHVGSFLSRAWPLLAFCAAGGVVSWRLGGRPWRDSAVWLWLGGLAIVPAMAKYGALWTYLLPLLCATTVLAGRWWSGPMNGPSSPVPRWGALLAAALGGWLAATRTFLLPDPLTQMTAEAFYAFVRHSADYRSGPILATRPEYAYFVAGQPVEVEAVNFALLIERQAPGMERVLAQLRNESYRLVIWNPEWYPRQGPYLEALVRGYRPIGGCTLAFMDGASDYTFFVPRTSNLAFHPPARSRCWR